MIQIFSSTEKELRNQPLLQRQAILLPINSVAAHPQPPHPLLEEDELYTL